MAHWRTLFAHWNWQTLEAVAFPALTTLLGLQLLRVLLNSLVFYLRDSLGAPTYSTGVYAFVLFLVTFLAAPLSRIVSPSRALLATVGGLVAARLAEQFVEVPIAELALATAGTGLFLLTIPLYLARMARPNVRAGEPFAMGLLLGIAADTALKGASATLDLSWQTGPLADVVTAGLVVALAWLAWRAVSSSPRECFGGAVTTSLPLLALGPVLFLELLFFQNVGQQTVLLEWSQPRVLAWVCLANTLGIAAGVRLMRWERSPGWAPALLVGLVLVLAVSGERSGAVSAGVVLAGQIALALLVTQMGMALGRPGTRPCLVWVTLGGGLGMLLLMVLMFVYYAGYELAIPLGQRTVLMLGAGIVAAMGLIGTRLLPHKRNETWMDWTPAWAAAALLLLPLGYSLAWDEPDPVAGASFPVRVMSYNLHQGFDTSGRLDMEALAQVIEGQAPDIIAIQEVSRGWAIDGAFDMLPWLSRRLDMTYTWGPAADSVWGNAILSRYPIVEARTYPMPNNDQLRLKRAFTTAIVNIGNGQNLTVTAVHLHNPLEGGAERKVQVQALLDFWGGKERTVLLGDFNADPSDPEIALLREAGLVDTFPSSGAPGTGYTARSDDPHRRIDYIWVSADLRPSAFSIPQSRSSDHFAVAVTLDD